MEEQFEYKEEDIQTEKEHQEITQTPQVGLDRNRKIAVLVLVTLAFFMIITWSRNLDYKLNDPFTYKGTDTGTSTSEEGDSVAALRAKDTDGDGLSDWDELNVYNTSPYLEDSDSDGFSDFEEIMNGTDPNCAEGADCGKENAILSETAEGLDVEVSDFNFNSTSILSAEEISAVRESFLEAGYSKSEIDSMSDQEIFEAYLLVAQNYNQKESSSNSNEGEQLDVNVSSDEAAMIRKAYIEAGYDQETLDKISDDDLIKAYNEAKAAYENN